MKDLTEEKLLDLFCKKVTEGLDREELKQLEQLEKAFPAWKGDESFEVAAAAINLTAVDPGEAMPVHLKSKILADADEIFGSEFQKTFKIEPDRENGGAFALSSGRFQPRSKNIILAMARLGRRRAGLSGASG